MNVLLCIMTNPITELEKIEQLKDYFHNRRDVFLDSVTGHYMERHSEEFDPTYLAERGGYAVNMENLMRCDLTPLHVAAQEGLLVIVTWLVEQQGARVNLGTSTSATPLYIAAQKGHVKVMEYLLSKGAHVDQPLTSSPTSTTGIQTMGSTPLHAAVRFGQVAAVQLLLKNNADLIKNSKNEDPHNLAIKLLSITKELSEGKESPEADEYLGEAYIRNAENNPNPKNLTEILKILTSHYKYKAYKDTTLEFLSAEDNQSKSFGDKSESKLESSRRKTTDKEKVAAKDFILSMTYTSKLIANIDKSSTKIPNKLHVNIIEYISGDQSNPATIADRSEKVLEEADPFGKKMGIS